MGSWTFSNLRYIAILHFNLTELINILAAHKILTRYDYY